MTTKATFLHTIIGGGGGGGIFALGNCTGGGLVGFTLIGGVVCGKGGAACRSLDGVKSFGGGGGGGATRCIGLSPF